MNTFSDTKSYSFNLERDQVTTRREIIIAAVFGIILTLNGLIYVLNAITEGSFKLDFFVGVFITIAGIIGIAGYFVQHKKSRKAMFYLTIHQGILRYRWGAFQKEKEVSLDQLNYTTSSPYEIILRLFDKSEIFIDYNQFKNPTKFEELKEVLRSYHQKNKREAIKQF